MGVVVFSESKRYVSRDEWAADSARHGVDPSAAPEDFGWTEAVPKYGWVVERVEARDARPCPLSEAQRIFRSLFRLLPTQVGCDEEATSRKESAP